MKKIIFAAILGMGSRLFAQSYDEGYSHHQLGLEASMLTGYAVTYSYIFDSAYRIKTTLWGYFNDNGNGTTYWTESTGLEFEWTLIRYETSRFYGLVGGFYYTRITTATYSTAEHDFAAGIGIGFEFMLWKHIALNIDGTYEYAAQRYNPSNIYSPNSRYFGPGIGAGVGYRF